MFAEENPEWGCICCHDFRENGGLDNSDGWNIWNVRQKNVHPGSLNVLVGYNMTPK